MIVQLDTDQKFAIFSTERDKYKTEHIFSDGPITVYLLKSLVRDDVDVGYRIDFEHSLASVHQLRSGSNWVFLTFQAPDISKVAPALGNPWNDGTLTILKSDRDNSWLFTHKEKSP